MILASGIRELMELCQKILDLKGMPTDWATRAVIRIYKGKRYHDLCHV